MDPAGHPTVLIAAELGFEARNLLRSSFFAALATSGARLIVLVPDPNDDQLVRELGNPHVILARLEVETARERFQRSRFERYLTFARGYALTPGEGILFLDEKADDRLRKRVNPSIMRLLRPLIGLLRHSDVAKRTLVWLERRLFRTRFYRDLFDRYRPDVIVMATPGYLPHDTYLLREAQGHGVRTITLFSSWDAATSKGLRGINADAYIVWSDRMKADLIEFQGVQPRRISVGGVPYFDQYGAVEPTHARSYLVEKYRLELDRCIIVVGTKSPLTYPNFAVIELLARAVEEDAFSKPCQLIVRLHPLHAKPEFTNSDEHRKAIREYDRIAATYDHVRFNVPQAPSSAIRVDFGTAEAREIAMLLYGSDVLITFFSTLVLEACICDTPTVNVCFDPDLPPNLASPRYRPIRVDRDQLHNRRTVEDGGVAVANDPQELVHLVDRYLQDRTLDAEARCRTALLETGPADGQAGKRIADFVLEASGARWRRRVG